MHVRHRVFTDWIEEHCPEWMQIAHIPNKYPYIGTDNNNRGALAEFYIYKKTGP
jgi:hypothetical protein